MPQCSGKKHQSFSTGVVHISKIIVSSIMDVAAGISTFQKSLDKGILKMHDEICSNSTEAQSKIKYLNYIHHLQNIFEVTQK